MGLFTKTKNEFGTVWTGKDKNGKDRVVETPNTKSNRYYNENKNGKKTYTGELMTDTQKAFRSGYMQSQKDNSTLYKHKQSKTSK